MNITVKPHNPDHSDAWDDIVRNARNSHFMHMRGYIDYHGERFDDASIVAVSSNRLRAVFPANKVEDRVYSHQGLSFGGWIVSPDVQANEFFDIFHKALTYYRDQGFSAMSYKAMPHIYHCQPAEEESYALFRQNAELCRVELSSTINLRSPGRLSNGKRTGLNRAKREGVEIRETGDFETFFAIVAERVGEKYGAQPVHTAAEMTILKQKFPNNIRLYGAFVCGVMEAGCLVYLTPQVCHAQYIASTATGRKTRAVDAVIGHLIEKEVSHLNYLDFGHSTEFGGRKLNLNLCSQKEEFGARGTCQYHYEIDLLDIQASVAKH